MKNLLPILLLIPSVCLANPCSKKPRSQMTMTERSEWNKCMDVYLAEIKAPIVVDSSANSESVYDSISRRDAEKQAEFRQQDRIDELKRSNDLLEQQIQQDREFNNRLLAEIEN